MNNSKLFVFGISLLVLTLAAPLTSEAQRGGGGRGGGGGMSGGGFSRGGMAPGGFSRGGMLHRAAFLVPEWPRAAPVLPVLTGTVAALGTAVTTGAVRIGTAVIGTIIGEIRTVDGAGGTATSGVLPGTTSCSSVVLVFHGGGAGAGALGQAGAGAAAGAGVAATVTTGAVIRTTVAAMAIPIMAMAMDMARQWIRCRDAVRKYGNSSQSRVAELQRRLSRAGYYHGSIDGVLGPQTRRAIRDYEQKHGDVG